MGARGGRRGESGTSGSGAIRKRKRRRFCLSVCLLCLLARPPARSSVPLSAVGRSRGFRSGRAALRGRPRFAAAAGRGGGGGGRGGGRPGGAPRPRPPPPPPCVRGAPRGEVGPGPLSHRGRSPRGAPSPAHGRSSGGWTWPGGPGVPRYTVRCHTGPPRVVP